MEKIMLFLFGLIMSFSLMSCATTVYAQDDTYFDGEVDASVVISYGTPYIVNNMVVYYSYRGWYYYPYWIDNTYYFHRYRRPLSGRIVNEWYRPIPRTHVYHRPPHHTRHDIHRPHNQRQMHRHNIPNTNNRGRTSPRPHGNHNGNGRFGGRR